MHGNIMMNIHDQLNSQGLLEYQRYKLYSLCTQIHAFQRINMIMTSQENDKNYYSNIKYPRILMTKILDVQITYEF